MGVRVYFKGVPQASLHDVTILFADYGFINDVKKDPYGSGYVVSFFCFFFIYKVYSSLLFVCSIRAPRQLHHWFHQGGYK